MSKSAETLFRSYAVQKLAQYRTRIDDCLAKLNEAQIWHRFGERGNSVGNLVLHLCGNVRQWIGFGVAGEADVRMRDGEFAAGGGLTADDLRAGIGTAVEEAIGQIVKLPEDDLLSVTTVQVYTLSKLEAIFHVVEHFSMHTGQIIFITKALTGEDLGFYGFLSGTSSTADSAHRKAEDPTP